MNSAARFNSAKNSNSADCLEIYHATENIYTLCATQCFQPPRKQMRVIGRFDRIFFFFTNFHKLKALKCR